MTSRLGWFVVWASLLAACGPGLPTPGPMPPGQTFVGAWESTWGKLKLMQNGKRVYGPFTGFRHGSISGEQDGDLLRFHWIQKENQQSGHGYLRMSPDGKTLEGRWGYVKSHDNGGSWSARRGQPDSDSDSGF